MGKKIAFIGAGSLVFTRNLVRDICSFPAFADATVALMDIDEERLHYAKAAVEKISRAKGVPLHIEATTDRAEALDGADGVLATVMIGNTEARYHDIRIPLLYGVDQNIGDTRGPGGLFKFLRTLPVMLSICSDIERYCPRAVFLNYTNPMAMLCRTMQQVSRINVTGLCHSVQGTADMLAKWIGAPREEIDYVCAGINHQAFYLKFTWKGEDAYPLIRQCVEERPEIYQEEIVRNEMFLHLGYYVTESSGHNSEYNPWFRKRPELIDKYCVPGTGWNPGASARTWVSGYEQRQAAIANGEQEEPWKADIKAFLEEDNPENWRSGEYAIDIFNAHFGDNSLFEFNGNVRNYGLVDNLPNGACVEVPVLASRRGLSPMHVGALPASCAILVSHNAQIEELMVQGALERNKVQLLQALYHDPLTAAVCSMAEIKSMFDQMWAENAGYLEWFED